MKIKSQRYDLLDPKRQPIDLDTLKRFIQVDFDEDDALLGTLLRGAISTFEVMTGYITRPAEATVEIEGMPDIHMMPYRPRTSTVEGGNGIYTYEVGTTTLDADVELVILEYTRWIYEHRGQGASLPAELRAKIMRYSENV
jgi:hypothetical protein